MERRTQISRLFDERVCLGQQFSSCELAEITQNGIWMPIVRLDARGGSVGNPNYQLREAEAKVKTPLTKAYWKELDHHDGVGAVTWDEMFYWRVTYPALR